MPYHEEALAMFRQLDDRPGTAETLDLMGLAHACHGDLIRAAACLDEALALLQALGEREALVTTLTMRQSFDQTYETATMVPAALTGPDVSQPAGEALHLARSLGLRGDEPFALFIQAQSLAVRGDYAAALPLAREALATAEEMGHAQWRTGAEYVLGAIALDLCDPPAALGHLERAVALANEIGSLTWLRIASGELGAACVAAGELARAEAVLLAALGGDRPLETIGGRLVGAGQVELALARGAPEQALQLVEQLIATAPHAQETAIPRLWLLRGEALVALSCLPEAEAVLLEAKAVATALGLRPLLWRIHAALGHVRWAAGRRAAARAAFATADTLIDALAVELPETLQTTFRRGALTRLPRPQRAGQQSLRTRLPDGLTPREAEILRLLAGGRDNRTIARTLVLSERTVEGHIASVYGKIGASGRTARAAAAAYALRHGLAGDEAGSRPA
jgi:DNA-binding CsgD family transcriptional regulator